MWIFEIQRILYIRVILTIGSIFFEMYRLIVGYNANIQESVRFLFIQFPNLLQTLVITIIFALPCQIGMVVFTHVCPIDYASAGISIAFIIIEIVLIIRAITRSISKQAAVFHLRNSATKTFNTTNQIKSSAEIEEELYTLFPYM